MKRWKKGCFKISWMKKASKSLLSLFDPMMPRARHQTMLGSVHLSTVKINVPVCGESAKSSLQARSRVSKYGHLLPSPRCRQLSPLLRRHVGRAAPCRRRLQPTGGVPLRTLTLTFVTLLHSNDFLWTDNRDSWRASAPNRQSGLYIARAVLTFPFLLQTGLAGRLSPSSSGVLTLCFRDTSPNVGAFLIGWKFTQEQVAQKPHAMGSRHCGDKNGGPHLECESQAHWGVCVSNQEVDVVVGKSKRGKVINWEYDLFKPGGFTFGAAALQGALQGPQRRDDKKKNATRLM